MKLIENETKLIHRNMISWGVGIYRESSGDCVSIDFENVGIKKISRKSVSTMLKLVDEKTESNNSFSDSNLEQITVKSSDNQSSSLTQFDGEKNSIAGKNVIESFESNDIVIFNESYTIVGDETKTLKIQSMYDLTVLGNLTVQECIVNGSLTVIGDARISKLSCDNSFVCRGNLYSQQIYVGSNIIANSIVCDELVCDGNVSVQTTANINENAEIGKTIVAYEGVMGAGKFTALNAVANEYFEFEGVCEGKIIELEADATPNKIATNMISCDTIEDVVCLSNKKLSEEFDRMKILDEIQLVERLKHLGSIQSTNFVNLPVVESLFLQLTDISYQECIESIDDLLTILIAKKTLPIEIYKYESIDHIDNSFLPRARNEIDKLKFEPTTIEHLVKILSMTVDAHEELSENFEDILDRIFESIGIKYSTVNSIIRRNKPKTNTQPAIMDPVQDEKNFNVLPQSTIINSQIIIKDFLAQKINETGKSLGLTNVEIERMVSAKIFTVEDFVSSSNDVLINVLGKKAFLASHLLQIKEKTITKIKDMD